MRLLYYFERPKNVKIIDIGDNFVTYVATYADGKKQTVRRKIKSLGSSAAHSRAGRIRAVEFIGKFNLGFFKIDTLWLFLLTLSDGTVDIVKEKDGSSACKALITAALGDEENDREEASTATDKKREHLVSEPQIPLEILPNLYSLSVSNLSMKHHTTYENGEKEFDYLTLKCKVNYSLGGRREGKRHLIFTSYDEKGGVLDIRGEGKRYHFTEAGYEIIEVCFDDFGNNPASRISLSVKEI